MNGTTFRKRRRKRKKIAIRQRDNDGGDDVEDSAKLDNDVVETKRTASTSTTGGASVDVSRSEENSMLSFGGSSSTFKNEEESEQEFKIRKSKSSRRKKSRKRVTAAPSLTTQPSTYTQVSVAGMYSKENLDLLRQSQNMKSVRANRTSLDAHATVVPAAEIQVEEEEDPDIFADRKLDERIRRAKEMRSKKKQMLTEAQEYIPLDESGMSAPRMVDPETVMSRSGDGTWEAQQIHRARHLFNNLPGESAEGAARARPFSETSLRSLTRETEEMPRLRTLEAIKAALKNSLSRLRESSEILAKCLCEAKRELEEATSDVERLEKGLSRKAQGVSEQGNGASA